ncbi:MAG: T9SS type A sorting domain-containing protein, partial [Bacteroidota bacterium]
LQTDGTLFFLKVSAKTLILNTRNVVISFQQNTILLNEGFPVPLLSTGTARVTRLPLGIELLLPANDSTDAPGSVRFVWKANSIATAYDLQVSRGSNSFTSPIVVENLADTAHVLDNLEFSSTYFWRVRGKNSFGNGDWSAPFRFSTLVPPNTPPYNEVRIGERTRTEDFPTFIASKVDTVFFDNDTGDSLSFTLQSTPNHVVARLNGPNLEIESLPDAFGRDSIIVRATDRGGLFVQDTLFMNVLPLNDEPRITDDLPDTLRIRNDSTLVLDMFFLVFDPDHPTDSLTLTVGSSASQVNVAVGDSLKTTITAPGFVGQSNLLFTLTDPLGASGVKNVVLIVTDSSTPNLPPVITNDLPDTLNMRVDETFAVDMFFIVFDPDHPTDSLELKVTTPVSGLNITVGDSLETTITSSGFTGNAQLTFTLTDPEGASDTRIVTLIVAGTTSTEWTRNLPEQLELRQNYPNPFNPSTTIGFGIPESAHVRVEVYNMLGQQVEVLVNQRMSAGWHTLIFDASRLSSGMYVYRVVSGAQVQTRKMVLVK